MNARVVVHRWRYTRLAGVLVALGLGAGAISSAAAAPAGTITARIPIAGAAQAAVAGGHVWVIAAEPPRGRRGLVTRLVRVNPRSGRVVDPETRFNDGSPAQSVRALGGRLWAFGGSTVYRIDPRRGRVTGRVALDGRAGVSDLELSGNTLLVVRGGSSPQLLRFDARTLRPCRATCTVPAAPRLPRDALALHVRDRTLFVTTLGFNGPSTLTRLAARGGARRTAVLPGGEPLIIGSSAYAPGADGLARLDLRTFTYDVRVTRTGGRTVTHLTRGLGGLWAGATLFEERPRTAPRLSGSRLYRVDPATGSLVGDPVVLPSAPFGLTTGAGSVWIVTADGLLRIRPTRARLALTPPADPTSPSPLLAGPLAPITYLSPPAFGVALSITLTDAGWLSVPPFGSSGSLAREVIDLQRADSRFGRSGIVLPAGVFGSAGRVTVATPAEAIAAWQSNPALSVTAVTPTTVSGRPAIAADLRVTGRRAIKVIGLTGDFISLVDDGSAGPPLRVVLTQTSSGRLVMVLASRGPADPSEPFDAVIQGLSLP